MSQVAIDNRKVSIRSFLSGFEGMTYDKGRILSDLIRCDIVLLLNGLLKLYYIICLLSMLQAMSASCAQL